MGAFWSRHPEESRRDGKRTALRSGEDAAAAAAHRRRAERLGVRTSMPAVRSHFRAVGRPHSAEPTRTPIKTAQTAGRVLQHPAATAASSHPATSADSQERTVDRQHRRSGTSSSPEPGAMRWWRGRGDRRSPASQIGLVSGGVGGTTPTLSLHDVIGVPSSLGPGQGGSSRPRREKGGPDRVLHCRRRVGSVTFRWGAMITAAALPIPPVRRPPRPLFHTDGEPSIGSEFS